MIRQLQVPSVVALSPGEAGKHVQPLVLFCFTALNQATSGKGKVPGKATGGGFSL